MARPEPRFTAGVFCMIGLLIAAVSCNDQPGTSTNILSAGTGRAVCNSPQKITAIYKEYVYDLSGYADVTGPSAFALFDENYADPKSISDFIPVTSPVPRVGTVTYFKDYGNRIVVDLRVPYKLSEIYLYDRARQSDTVWIYTGTMKEWKLSAQYVTRGDPAGWGWRRFGITDSTRFVMFRFRSVEAEIAEAVMYGCALETPPPPPPGEYTGPRLPPKPLKEFLGVNCYQGTPTQYMEPFYYSRVYTNMGFIDRDTVNEYPNIKYNITPHGWWNNGIQDYVLYVDSMHRMGKKTWYSYLGIPAWLHKAKYPYDKRPITRLGQNMEDPLSYARHSNMLWNMAACYGSTPVDTNLIQASNEHRFSGRGVMNLYENGNESDAFSGANYCNPVEYFAQSSADYDGHEGRLGPRHGIKNADPHSELMMAGMTRFDTNRLRILKFLCDNLRSDSQFLWKGGIQYHWYSTNGTGTSPGEVFMSARGGITPEEDSLRVKLTRARNATYRIQPGVECILGEYGYDKSQQSKVSAPLVPGYSPSQSQGIMLLRAINAIFMSGFDRYIIYWMVDNYDEDNPALFNTSGLLRQYENYYVPYPAWYYISTLYNHLGNYIPDKIIRETGDVWVYRWRHQAVQDSVAYFVYCPTRSGKKVSDFELEVGTVDVNTALELNFKEASTEGELISRQVINNVVRMEVTEFPKIVMVKEGR